MNTYVWICTVLYLLIQSIITLCYILVYTIDILRETYTRASCWSCGSDHFTILPFMHGVGCWHPNLFWLAGVKGLKLGLGSGYGGKH